MNQKALPAVAADILGLIAFVALIVPFFSERFRVPSVNGGSILFFVFLAVAFGINRIKRLEQNSGDAGRWLERFDFSQNQSLMIILALVVVIIFTLTQVEMNNLFGDTVNLFEGTGEVHEGEMTLYVTFGPVFIWFIAGALYLIGFALPTEKSIPVEARGYVVTEFVVLLLINVLIGLFALYFSGWIGRVLPAAGTVATFLFVLIILELLFIPTRMRHSLKNPQILSIASFLIMLLGIVMFAL